MTETVPVSTPGGALAVGVARPVNGRARAFALEEFWPTRRPDAYDEFCR